jgi:hypothetical protein
MTDAKPIISEMLCRYLSNERVMNTAFLIPASDNRTEANHVCNVTVASWVWMTQID